MVRRVRSTRVAVDVPEWVFEYHPSPAFPSVYAWFLAVREYAQDTRLVDRDVSLWLHVMAGAYAQRRRVLDRGNPGAVLAAMQEGQAV